MIPSEKIQSYLNHPIFLRRMGLAPESRIEWKPLAQGEYNANYLFRTSEDEKKWVLRLNFGSQMHLDHQIAYEFNALKLLEASGRTPRVLFYDEDMDQLPYGALVMEWLPGRPLRYETDMRVAAMILADIHALPLPSAHTLLAPEHPADNIYRECLEMAEHYLIWDQADPSVKCYLRKMIEVIGQLPLQAESIAPRCIVNTELNSGNFLINEGTPSYLIDWEKPLYSEPAQDLAHFLVPTTTYWKTDVILDVSQIRDFYRHYLNALGGRMDTSVLAERIKLFFRVTCLRGISWCAMAKREYEQPGRSLKNEYSYRKINAFLEEDFLRMILDTYMIGDFLED